LELYPVELHRYELMPNHGHLVLRPLLDGEMGRFMKWVTGTHTVRYHAAHHTGGQGHV
jgi:putative transposase